MNELVVNGKHYPMWSSVIDKKANFKRVVNIDMGLVAAADLRDIRLEPNGKDSAMVVFAVHWKGQDTEWGVDVQYAGIAANTTSHKGLCISTTFTGSFILQTEEDIK